MLGLAPGGVCLAGPVTRAAGGLLHHLFTLTSRNWPERRPVFCGTCRRVTPPGRYPAPRSVEFGLSSETRQADTASLAQRPSGPLVRSWMIACGRACRQKPVAHTLRTVSAHAHRAWPPISGRSSPGRRWPTRRWAGGRPTSTEKACSGIRVRARVTGHSSTGASLPRPSSPQSACSGGQRVGPRTPPIHLRGAAGEAS